ncbi:MAG TPA: beta-ketoacyl synthase N-terminal-like domain-containing protein, partial [Isosphaeraceae bacterium]
MIRHDPVVPPTDLSTLIDLLRLRADAQPETRAFTFLADGEGGDRTHLTHADLDRRARAIGARLRGQGLAGQRALLVYPPGLEFIAAFFGCLYAGSVAVPAYPPRPNRPMTRLRAIAADARPRAVLTTSALRADAEAWSAGVPELRDLERIATDAIADDAAEDWRDPGAGPRTLAFLQYTSGSTAVPKGVMITHGNLLANSKQIRDCFGATATDRGVFWLPLFHDMGLIGGVLQTLSCGGSSTLLSPVAFLQRPVRWLQAISATGATISGGPNFAYDLCTRKVTPEQRATLDLSRWRVAFNGAEPVRAETLERFAAAFAPCGFRRAAFLPCYGLAEATLLVSGGPPAAPPVVFAARAGDLAADRVVPADATESDARTLVGSGRLAADVAVRIVDPHTRLSLPADRVGEIWVRGPGVAQGYWERPEATAETFRALPADAAGAGAGPFLRTGDLGFLRAGELFVAGRLKDLIIVGGRNVYPQDVEWTVQGCHPALRPEAAAAFAVEVGGEPRLVVVAEVERLGKDPAAAEGVLAAVRRAVASEHELDVHAIRLIKALSIPKTSSGKIQRHACRAAFLAEALDVVGSWTRSDADRAPAETSPVPVPDPVQAPEPSPRSPRPAAGIAAWLAARVAGPLGIGPEAIDVRRPLADFGLGSMQAVSLAGELEQWLGRPLAPTLVYEHPTIEALARYLAEEPGPEAVGAGSGPGPNEPAGPIAIIGIGCRFPGASGPEAFWRLLRDGRDAVGAIPAGRWAAADGGDAGRVDIGRGGFLERVDGFDADFFGISAREAARTDPQQRLLLEVAWEALEDAGQVPGRLAGAAVGVFIGIATGDYGRLQGRGAGPGEAYVVTGNAASIAANRLSYAFDFRGPSLALDTACSSSLAAVHQACQSLRGGEAELALAGGVNLILAPEVSAQLARAGFLAPDGRCKAFDASADGYVRGEGAGLVVLKPLGRALADGDPIYAVIRGGAINQDGRTNGLTAPSRSAQEAVLRTAYRRAGVIPGRVRYVEAHGTGTLLGDPIEAHALGAVLAEGRPADRPCALGSVKTNIGHLEAAAGVAGLIKVALALHHRAIPPSLHFRDPNPHIPFAALGLGVQREPGAWPETDAPPVAGISSFGFGGTNVHLVLEGAPSTLRSGRPDETTGSLPGSILPAPMSEPFLPPLVGEGRGGGGRCQGDRQESGPPLP